MKCVRTPIIAEVVKYEYGRELEDGFELFADVITKDFIDVSNVFQIEKDGKLVCPYIHTRRGKTFIKPSDYIVMEEDGTKLVCGADKVKTRYKCVE